MRFFGVCLILGALGLFAAETFPGYLAFTHPEEANGSESVALVRFFEAQAILVFGYFVPWITATLGISLIVGRLTRSRTDGNTA